LNAVDIIHYFFFQAEDGIRDFHVTGVQTCALPISEGRLISALPSHSHVCESYRALRSSISFSGIDAPLATLGVSSARAGEGKTRSEERRVGNEWRSLMGVADYISRCDSVDWYGVQT